MYASPTPRPSSHLQFCACSECLVCGLRPQNREVQSKARFSPFERISKVRFQGRTDLGANRSESPVPALRGHLCKLQHPTAWAQCRHSLRFAPMTALRTLPSFDFRILPTQHLFAFAARQSVISSRRHQSGRLKMDLADKSNPFFRCLAGQPSRRGLNRILPARLLPEWIARNFILLFRCVRLYRSWRIRTSVSHCLIDANSKFLTNSANSTSSIGTECTAAG